MRMEIRRKNIPGARQLWLLNQLRKHGSWTRGCGWGCGKPSNTERALEGLVRQGLARKEPHDGHFKYLPVEAGEKEP